MFGSASFGCFAAFLFSSSLFGINFRERTFVFGGRCWFCVFDSACLRFCFIFWRFAPKTIRKNSLNIRFSVLGSFSLSLVVFASTSFLCFCVFFKRHSSGLTGHTSHCVRWSCSFFPLCPSRAWFIARFGCASFLAFCRGAIVGPGVLALFGFSRNVGWLEVTRPLLRPFLGREAAWVFAVGFVCLFFLSFCGVCGNTFLLGPSRRSMLKWAEQRGSRLPLGIVISRGEAPSCAGWTPV